MKPPCATPCEKCPFRRLSLPGYLGESTPREFLEQVLSETEMPCHLTVDYSTPFWREEMETNTGGSSDARLCAGALVFQANVGKLPRDGSRPRLSRDTQTVFASPQEFLAHHHDWQNGEKPKVDLATLAERRKGAKKRKRARR